MSKGIQLPRNAELFAILVDISFFLSIPSGSLFFRSHRCKKRVRLRATSGASIITKTLIFYEESLFFIDSYVLFIRFKQP